MSSTATWSRVLTRQQVWYFCLFALIIHILPLILADFPYIDDSWRAQLAGNDWVDQGRPLTAALLAVLGFTAGAPNLFPLPLLLAVFISAHALTRLVFYWFAAPTLGAVLVVLPLWYNPLFLQNLSYQYDGAAMALALCTCIWAITQGAGSFKAWWRGAVLVALAAGFYQASVNLFAGLCALEVMRQVLEGVSLREAWQQVVGRVFQLIGGCALYYLTCAWLITVPRTALLKFDSEWGANMASRLGVAGQDIALLLTPGTSWFVYGMLILALVALSQATVQLCRRRVSWLQRLALWCLLCAPLPLMYISIPGIALLFAHFDHNARLLMGFGAVLVTMAYLAHRALTNLDARWGGLLAVPLLFMLSFSYAHGRVLVAQKELQQAVVSYLAHDIMSKPELASARRYFVQDIWLSRRWLPAANGSIQAMPALGYVLNVWYLVLPELMPREGLANFFARPPIDREQVLARSPSPIVGNKFYSIHLVGDTAYVLMKSPPETEVYQ
ncbi:glucosyltransferase domain-containing protein [Pseudomonas sp. TE50-2]|uniref:glucosyltransferase domain-containing protein n=1 Tax=Pseudomonas sp. TE50-2 TaxID=3142707 RepID=UPI0034671A91